MTYTLTPQDIERADSTSRWFNKVKRVSPQNWEDYIAVGRLGLVKAAHSYRAELGFTFHTYAHHCVLGQLRDYIRSNYVRHFKHPKPHTNAISLDYLMETGWEPSANGLEDRIINKDLCSKLLKTLKFRERLIFNLYYFHDIPMKHIGDMLGYTDSRIFQIINKYLPILKKRALNWISTPAHQSA